MLVALRICRNDFWSCVRQFYRQQLLTRNYTPYPHLLEFVKTSSLSGNNPLEILFCRNPNLFREIVAITKCVNYVAYVLRKLDFERSGNGNEFVTRKFDIRNPLRKVSFKNIGDDGLVTI